MTDIPKINPLFDKRFKPSQPARPTFVIVKKGETLSQIATRFNMTHKDFMTWTGLKKSSIKAGQRIDLPHANVLKGEGLFAFARRHSMTLDEVCKLNGISKNYKPIENEIFYVKSNAHSSKASGSSSTASSSAAKKPQNQQKTQKPKEERTQKTEPPKTTATSKKPLVYTPEFAAAIDTSYVQPNPPIITPGGTKAQRVTPSDPSTKPLIPMDTEGNVVAEVRKYAAMPAFGPLTGKTIMVNAGHGWGSDSNGKPKFAPGTFDADNTREWYRARQFADELIKSLTSRGATVIFTSGDAKQVCNAKREYKTDMVISLHMNSAQSKSAYGIQTYYHAGDEGSKELAETVTSHMGNDNDKDKDNAPNMKTKTQVKADNESQHTSIGILTNLNNYSVPTPSILVECGFMTNPTDASNMGKKDYRQKSMEKLTNGVIEYFDEHKDDNKWKPRMF